MRYILLIALISITLFGCGKSKDNYNQIVDREVKKLLPPSQALSTYGSFKLEKMVIDKKILDEKVKADNAKILEKKIEEKLNALFAELNKKNPSAGKTLIVKPYLNELRVISGGSRFFLGALSGKSHIDMDLKLLDQSTGQPIAQPKILLSSSSNSGAYSMGATDRNLLNYIADVSYEYLKRNYK